MHKNIQMEYTLDIINLIIRIYWENM